jgi:hypothetical protein
MNGFDAMHRMTLWTPGILLALKGRQRLAIESAGIFGHRQNRFSIAAEEDGQENIATDLMFTQDSLSFPYPSHSGDTLTGYISSFKYIHSPFLLSPLLLTFFSFASVTL